MAARCTECQEHVSSEPYPDEKQLAKHPCAECEEYLCEDCSIRLGGICSDCKKVITGDDSDG